MFAFHMLLVKGTKQICSDKFAFIRITDYIWLCSIQNQLWKLNFMRESKCASGGIVGVLKCNKMYICLSSSCKVSINIWLKSPLRSSIGKKCSLPWPHTKPLTPRIIEVGADFQLGWSIPSNLTYSPDFVPTDYFFQSLQNILIVKTFSLSWVRW